MADLSLSSVNQGFQLLQQAQTAAKKIESEPLYSRVHIGATAATLTGLVQAGVVFNFFGGTQGQVGNGFTREITPADQSSWVNGNQTTGGVAFMGSAPYIHFHYPMPASTQLQLAAYGKLVQDRLGTQYLFPRGFELPSGRGVLATAVSTAVNDATIQSWGNGPCSPIYQVPEAAAIFIPPTQTVKFQYTVYAPYYATTDGAALAPGGGNALIPRTNNPFDPVNPEIAGAIDFGCYGVRFAVVG